MRILKALTLVAVAGALAAGSAQAQTGTGWLKFNSVGPTTAFGYYSSPYTGQFSLTGANSALLPATVFRAPGSANGPWGPVVDIFCVDYFHHTMSYAANFSNMSDLASVNTYTRVKDQTKYLMAAWLASQLPTHAADNAVINGTIWNLMSTAGLILTGDATPTSWLGQASANYGSVNAADWVVVTDKIGYMNQAGTFTVTGQGQEQIVNVTPEPATLLLLGTGLLTLMAAGVLRRSAV